MTYYLLGIACIVAACMSTVIIRKIHTRAILRLGGISFTPTILFTLALTYGLCTHYAVNILPPNPSNVFSEFALLSCGLILLSAVGIILDSIKPLQII